MSDTPELDDTPTESAADAAEVFLEQEAAPVVSVAAVQGRLGGRRNTALIGIGAVVGAAAAVAAVLERRRRTQDDPWALPLTDPYAAPASSDSTASGETGDSLGATDSTADSFDSTPSMPSTPSTLAGDADVNDPLGGGSDLSTGTDEESPR